eukprot:2261667-Prymnesium_polylepis.1
MHTISSHLAGWHRTRGYAVVALVTPRDELVPRHDDGTEPATIVGARCGVDRLCNIDAVRRPPALAHAPRRLERRGGTGRHAAQHAAAPLAAREARLPRPDERPQCRLECRRRQVVQRRVGVDEVERPVGSPGVNRRVLRAQYVLQQLKGGRLANVGGGVVQFDTCGRAALSRRATLNSVVRVLDARPRRVDTNHDGGRRRAQALRKMERGKPKAGANIEDRLRRRLPRRRGGHLTRVSQSLQSEM